MNMNIYAQAAKNLVNFLKQANMQKIKSKSKMNSKENIPGQNEGFGCDTQNVDEMEATKEFLTYPDMSTNEITDELADMVHKDGESSDGSDKTKMFDPNEPEPFEQVDVEADRLSAVRGGKVGMDVDDDEMKQKGKKRYS